MNSEEARQWEEEASRIDLDEMSIEAFLCSDDMATLSVSELAATDLMSRARVYVASRHVQPSPSIPYLACVCVTNQHHKAE